MQKYTKYGAFERRMIYFTAAMCLAFSGATYLCYERAPELFPLSFSIFFVFMILSIGLLIDEFILPVKTFAEISKNALAISLFWLSIVFLAVSGIKIGMSIVSDPFQGVKSCGYETTIR